MGQLENAKKITKKRVELWNKYHNAFENLENEEKLRRPIIPPECSHNAHMYYILLKDADIRSQLIAHLKKKGILAVFHYVPLHSSPAGKKYGKTNEKLPITDDVSKRILRLPLFYDMTSSEVQYVIKHIKSFLMNDYI
jgi:dTDP-4-amino-4,6-dideoxygalactose transaminase